MLTVAHFALALSLVAVDNPADDALRDAAEFVDKSSSPAIPRIKIQFWCALADLQHNLGNDKAAVSALQKAREIATATPNSAMLIMTSPDIAKSYARLGDVKSIRELVASFPLSKIASSKQQQVFQQSARAAAAAGFVSEANELADFIESAVIKTLVKATIVQTALVRWAQTGGMAGAIKAGKDLPDARKRVNVLAGKVYGNLTFDDHDGTGEKGIADIQLINGDKEGALTTAIEALSQLKNVDEKNRGGAGLAVVRILTKLDNLPAAEKALSQMQVATPNDGKKENTNRPNFRLIAQGYLAAAQVRAGREDLAVAIANDFMEPTQRAHIFQWIALAQSRTGKKDASKASFERAIQLCSEAKENQAITWHNIANALCLAGDYKEAIKTAERQPSERVIEWIPHYQAAAGDFKRSKKSLEIVAAKANQRDGSFERYLNLCMDIATLQAKANQTTAVREWAANETDPLVKGYILLGLAKGLHKEDDK